MVLDGVGGNVEFGISSMKHSDKVSIIILTINQLFYTKQCIASVIENTEHSNIELILVDNGSTDGTLKYLDDLSQKYEFVKIIVNNRNLGFAAAVNQGINTANGDYVVLLNNDTLVFSGWLTQLIAASKNSGDRVGLVGPRSNYVKGAQSIPSELIKGITSSNYQQIAQEWLSKHYGQYRETKRLVGFCLMIRREVLDSIGLLDERFAKGCYEDDDFCLRASQAGFRLIIADDILIYHFGSMSFKGNGLDISRIARQNRLKLIDKWNLRCKISFFLPWTEQSGGTWIAFEHANRLAELGNLVEIWTTQSVPNWFRLNVPVNKVDTFDRISTIETDISIVFSIFDLKDVFERVSGKVVHLCQGYEGFHYGGTLVDTMTDKAKIDELHRLPAYRIVISKHLQCLFKKKFGLDSFYVPNAVNEVFQSNSTNSIRQRQRILYVGRAVQSKGWFDLLEALNSVSRVFPDLVLDVAGYMPKAHFNKTLSLPFKVTHHGILSHTELAKLHNYVDLLVSPSWYEGFGLPALEAMASGTPVITTDNLGCREYCKDSKNCLMIPPGKPALLAEKIEQLLVDRELAEKLTEQGLKTASNYTWDKTMSYLEEALMRVYIHSQPHRAIMSAPTDFPD